MAVCTGKPRRSHQTCIGASRPFTCTRSAPAASTACITLCERARSDAYRLMLEHAADAGANALIGVRYDANEIAPGVTEVLTYGTAVEVVPASN